MSVEKKRAGRNRTITLAVGEEEAYLSHCLVAGDLLPGELPQDAIIHGDALSVLTLLPKGCVDLLIVDPPYNLTKTFGATSFARLSPPAYEDFTRAWLEAVWSLLKKTASLYVCADWSSSIVIGRVLSDYAIVRNRITWQREKGRGAKTNWKNTLEDIWFATVSREYTFNVEAVKERRRVLAPYRLHGQPKDWRETKAGNYRDTYPGNFWGDISVPYWSMPENTDHPTQKPEKLFAKLVLASSRAGDLVLDPFFGVGTTGVVAKKLGRYYLGIEKEASYCALAAKRLAQAKAGAAIQGYEDGVFWERNSRPAGKK